ncbi:rod shape-determining protein RodA [Oligoflexus tunisiensis]|uniref:rod shape-determining protein RodA n=1 Tax=Oligoflexus tunisiensis TaxID=708132 RepID=UPI000A7A89AA|nr:rod shape-determining protein RodA [Oligoflexus tunisiensis]
MKSKRKHSDGVFLLPEGDLKKPNSPQITLLILLFCGLLGIGLINLYSASVGAGFFWAQTRNLVITLSAFVFFGWVVSIKQVATYTYWFVALICVLLVIVLFTGRVAGGAQRWISIGPLSFQPSEFAKLAMAVLLARYFSSNRQDSPYRLRDLLPLLSVMGLIFALIFAQPDFGTAGVCLLIAVCQLAFIRIDIRSIAAVLLALPFVAAVGWNMFLMPYQKLRILNLLNPNLDPQDTGYHALQSLIAVGSGGLFGKGFMQGTQAHLRFLPERHTDFIFSVFSEEHGFWGSVLIFMGFGLLTYIALDIAKHSKDTFSGLLAIGLGSLLFLEFAINIAMVMGMFPVVGIPLPFFSYGSSAMLTVCTAIGLLISINRNNLGGRKS